MEQNIKHRVLKNSIKLYIRSFLTLLVSFFTSRVVLQTLGVENFGVYNLVGGIVLSLAFLNSTMVAAAQRFIGYEVGLGDSAKIQRTFSSLINVMAIFSVITFIILMCVGSYLIAYHLDFGNVNRTDAIWVLFFSALNMVVTINSIPYNALLIAFEDMGVFALLDILNAALKLIITLIIVLFDHDRLFFYVFLLFVASAFIRLLYSLICKKKHKEAVYQCVWDGKLVQSMLKFSGWSSLSAFTYILKTQGLSVIMNMFFGPLLNAAYGIASQVDNALRTMWQTFQLAYAPNITKSYAIGNLGQMNKLIYSGGKITTIIVLVISVPILIETEYILGLWLNIVPRYAPMVTRMVLLQTIFVACGCNSNSAVQATGNIKWMEMVCNTIDLIALPLSVLMVYFFRIYYLPFALSAMMMFITMLIRLCFLKRNIPSFNLRTYMTDVLGKNGLVAIIALIIPILLVIEMDACLTRLLLVLISFELVFILCAYNYCLLPYEKTMLVVIRNKIIKGNEKN